jgi:DNA-directed RNA polymerase alpha subunit
VDCEALVGKSFRLDGEEWEVIEADASSGHVKYARLCECDTEQEISLEELEEVTLNEASALRARESVEATALEVDALVRQYEEAVEVVEYSPDPDVRLIRNIWARKGVLERVRGVKFMDVGALCLQ